MGGDLNCGGFLIHGNCRFHWSVRTSCSQSSRPRKMSVGKSARKRHEKCWRKRLRPTTLESWPGTRHGSKTANPCSSRPLGDLAGGRPPAWPVGHRWPDRWQ
eukprot:2339878-Alexandrium_andersonii.AAC.1